MTRRRLRARPTYRSRPRPHARWPEVCPPVVIGPARACIVPGIRCGFLLTTTVRTWPGPPHAPQRRLHRGAQRVDRLMMRALGAMEVKDVAVLAAQRRQAVQLVAALLAEDGQLFAELRGTRHGWGGREFIELLFLAATGWPHAASAQTSPPISRIAVLMPYGEGEASDRAS